MPMKRIFRSLARLFLVTSVAFGWAVAQPVPVIHGDSLLCPNSQGLVGTQSFDTYQWYMRYFGSGQRNAITGATAQSLVIDYNTYSASYLSVHVSQGGDTATSPEFFVDGWAFLPPVVMTTGDFTTGGNGETIVCEGDTVFFTLMMPYDTLITWYLNGNPIPNSDTTVLAVTSAGQFTCSGAPTVCPNFIQTLGVNLDVVFEPCSTAVTRPALPLTVGPNPTRGPLQVEIGGHPIDRIGLVDAWGRQWELALDAGLQARLDLSSWPRGIYWLRVEAAGQVMSRPIQLH